MSNTIQRRLLPVCRLRAALSLSHTHTHTHTRTKRTSRLLDVQYHSATAPAIRKYPADTVKLLLHRAWGVCMWTSGYLSYICNDHVCIICLCMLYILMHVCAICLLWSCTRVYMQECVMYACHTLQEDRRWTACMYVCMYVCIYMHTHLYMHICIYLCGYIHVCMYTYIYTHTHM